MHLDSSTKLWLLLSHHLPYFTRCICHWDRTLQASSPAFYNQTSSLGGSAQSDASSLYWDSGQAKFWAALNSSQFGCLESPSAEVWLCNQNPIKLVFDPFYNVTSVCLKWAECRKPTPRQGHVGVHNLNLLQVALRETVGEQRFSLTVSVTGHDLLLH